MKFIRIPVRNSREKARTRQWKKITRGGTSHGRKRREKEYGTKKNDTKENCAKEYGTKEYGTKENCTKEYGAKENVTKEYDAKAAGTPEEKTKIFPDRLSSLGRKKAVETG